MMELYKGEDILDKVMHEMSYKEALLLRDIRIERLKKEREELEAQRKKDAAEQGRIDARNKIVMP